MKYQTLSLVAGYLIGEVFLLLLGSITTGFLQFILLLFGVAYAVLAVASPFMMRGAND